MESKGCQGRKYCTYNKRERSQSLSLSEDVRRQGECPREERLECHKLNECEEKNVSKSITEEYSVQSHVGSPQMSSPMHSHRDCVEIPRAKSSDDMKNISPDHGRPGPIETEEGRKDEREEDKDKHTRRPPDQHRTSPPLHCPQGWASARNNALGGPLRRNNVLPIECSPSLHPHRSSASTSIVRRGQTKGERESPRHPSSSPDGSSTKGLKVAAYMAPRPPSVPLLAPLPRKNSAPGLSSALRIEGRRQDCVPSPSLGPSESSRGRGGIAEGSGGNGTDWEAVAVPSADTMATLALGDKRGSLLSSSSSLAVAVMRDPDAGGTFPSSSSNWSEAMEAAARALESRVGGGGEGHRLRNGVTMDSIGPSNRHYSPRLRIVQHLRLTCHCQGL